MALLIGYSHGITPASETRDAKFFLQQVGADWVEHLVCGGGRAVPVPAGAGEQVGIRNLTGMLVPPLHRHRLHGMRRHPRSSGSVAW